jgi:HEAT repeat protein
VRSAAFRAISSLGGEEARKFLLEALKSTDSEVSRQAVEQLGQLGKAEDFDTVAAVFDREIAGLRPEGGRESYLPPAVRSALKVMVDLAPARSLSRVIKAINLCPSDYNTRAYLSTVATADNVMELIQAVQEVPVPGAGAGGPGASASRNSLHHAALMAIRKTKDKRALPYAVKLLASDDPTLRSAAAMAIGEVGGQEACEHLEKALNKALEEAEKSTSYASGSGILLIDALRATKESRACASLVKALGSKHSQLACYAASGLIYCVDPAQGDAIFRIWKETTNAMLKSALGNTLRYKREYGYVWDEADKTFKKAAADENKTLF